MLVAVDAGRIGVNKDFFGDGAGIFKGDAEGLPIAMVGGLVLFSEVDVIPSEAVCFGTGTPVD